MAAQDTGGHIVGIDLGTTFSAVAHVDDSGRVEVLTNADGHALTQSVVFFDDDAVLVGREAAKAALVEPERGAECFKRDIGMPAYNRPVRGEQMRPEELSAFVLRKLKQDAEAHIGPISGAVITVPAFFDDTRRKATEDAGRIVGLDVKAIINEPTAAAIFYGAHSDLEEQDSATFLVYDLGGGTFDATLMRLKGVDEFETIATDGDVMLGGRDWDKRLFDYVANEFIRKAGSDPREDDAGYVELFQRVEECKRTLSKRSSATVSVSHGGQRMRIPVTRERFEELTADLLARTQGTVELLLSDAGLSWDEVDRILLVGGSSHMPMVPAMLRKLSGKDPVSCPDIELAVAKGAALFAASFRDRVAGDGDGAAPVSGGSGVMGIRIKHRDVNSHSLGVEIENEAGAAENYIIIPKNTAIPCEVSAAFGTNAPSTDTRCKITIPILEGESRNPDVCIRVGTCVIDGLPAGLPEGSPVVVTFSYTDQGRIRVEAVAEELGARAQTQIVRDHDLSGEDLERVAASVMQVNVV